MRSQPHEAREYGKKRNPLVLTVEPAEDKLSQPGRPPDQ